MSVLRIDFSMTSHHVCRRSKMADVLHKDLLLHQIGNLVRIQPLKDGSSDGPALAIELKSHTVGLMEGSVPLSKEKGSQKIYGIIGLQKLVEGSAIAVITGAKQVRTFWHIDLSNDTRLRSSVFWNCNLSFLESFPHLHKLLESW